MVHKIFDKKTGSKTSANKSLLKNYRNQRLKKFKRRKLYARFKDNVWAACLAEMGSLSSTT